MKKVLSLVLAFAMILGSFGFVFASDFSDVKDTEYYSEPVNVLSGLGVIAGFPDGTFKPGDNVTRAQMATMITAALGIPVKGSGATGFSDVPASHWASGYIAYAVSVGFVAGYPDKTFKPENPVSYNEALTMIVASLGYTAETLPGVWPGAFVNKARGLGILDICATTGNAPAPRADIACFLYKALTANIGYVDKDGYWHANLDGNGNANDTMLTRLGAKVRTDKDGNELFFVIEGTEAADINLMNYMGAYASVYENKDGDIVAIKDIKSEFVEDTIKNLKNDYKIADKAQVAEAIYKSFKNGDVDETDTPYDTPTQTVKLAVKLDGKKIAEIYSMQVWIADSTFMADEDIQDVINAKTPKIGNVKFALDDDDKIDTSAFALNGVNALSEIKEDDVVTVYKGSDNTVARVDVSDKTIVGVITKIKDGKYTIGGTAYGLNVKPDTEAADLEKLMQDETSATYYLDYAGDIFYADPEEETTTNYAVLLDTGNEGGTWTTDSGKMLVKLFLADGTAKDFEVKSGSAAAEASVAPGDLVKYGVNSKDQVVTLEKGAAITNIEFDKEGNTAEKKVLKTSAIVFNYGGETTGDAKVVAKAKANPDNYSVLKVEDLYEAKVSGTAIRDGELKDGDYLALLAVGFETTDKIYTFFVEKEGTDKDGQIWTALYDGEVKTMTVSKDAKNKPEQYTTADALNYTLTFDGDVISDVDGSKALAAEKLDATAKGSVSGNVYKLGSNSYTLASDAVIYYFDGDEWNATTSKSYLAKIGEYFSDIKAFKKDSTTNTYDIVIVYVAE